MLTLLNKHDVRYLVVGGLAFTYHAKPRYTKDMDVWIEPVPENLGRANSALAEFGSPTVLSPDDPDEIIQIGIAPDRIDLIKTLTGVTFEEAWEGRVVDYYGEAQANWIGLDALLRVKEQIQHPRHQEDARILREVKRLREN
jgi:hypothetical protein